MHPGNIQAWQKWEEFIKAPQIRADQRKWFAPGSKVFMMGSGFTLGMYDALARQGVNVYPKYAEVVYDPSSQMFDRIPADRQFLCHFDIFVMRQEIEAALGKWPSRADGFCTLVKQPINQFLQAGQVIQDPYRKCNYARDAAGMVQLSDQVTAVVRQGLEEADILVFVPAVIETWRQNATGKFLCQNPLPGALGSGGMGAENATFHLSTFLENYTAMREMLDMIFARYPNKKVVLGVSPLRLYYTMTGMDVATATLEGKSTLRAVVGQIARDYGNRVLYFPAYELGMWGTGGLTGAGTVYEADGWAVKNEFLELAANAMLQVMS